MKRENMLIYIGEKVRVEEDKEHDQV